MTRSEEILKMLDAGFTAEEVKKIYLEPEQSAEQQTAQTDGAAAQQTAQPAASEETTVPAFDMNALNKAFESFIDDFNKSIEKINIKNSQMASKPEKSVEEILAEVVAPPPKAKKGDK